MKLKRIAVIMLCLFMCVVMGGEMILSAFSIPANAEEVKSFDSTTIEEDLGAEVVKMYPYQGYGDCEIIYLLEYAYSENSNYDQFYNLYFYVYNPTGNPISMLNEGYNLVSMLTGYGENGAKEINTVDLEFVKKTSDNLIYKFKLSDPDVVYSFAKEYAKTHNNIRHYEFTKLQVKTSNGLTQTKEFAKIYEFSGFSAYCDENKSPASTLQCRDFVNSSITLQLQHTNYRAGVQENGTQDELNSVYFSIPNRYYNDGDSLYGVKAEWYEYKTKPIYVTSDAGAYSGLWGMRNVRINEFGQAIDSNGNVIDETVLSYWRILWDETYVRDPSGYMEEGYFFGQSYNAKCRNDIDDDGLWDDSIFGDISGLYSLGYYNGVEDAWRYETCLDWLIYVDNITGDNAYKVSADKVKEYMQSYTNTFSSQPRIRDKYAVGLFTDSIDSDRISLLDNPQDRSGKVTMHFTSDDNFLFVDSDKTQSAWNKFWFGVNYENINYSPIVVISEGDLYLDTNTFAQKYYVNTQDVASIQTYARTSYSKSETPVLLRFAVTDYYSSSARFDYAEEDTFDLSDKDGYVAQETMFLDFNVINLDFKSTEGVIRSVGAVAEPIDVINGLTPPEDLVEDQEWWQKLVMIIMLVLLFVVISFLIAPAKAVCKVLWNSLKFIFSILIWLIELPYKLILWIFGKKRKRR